MPPYYYAGVVTVGTPPKVLQPLIESMRFVVNDFQHRTEKRGEYIETQAIIAHGYPWKLRMFPGRGNRGYVSLFIRYAGDDDEYANNYNGNNTGNSNNSAATVTVIGSGMVTARANFICKHHKKHGEIRNYTKTNDWGFEEFLERDRIMNNTGNTTNNNNTASTTTTTSSSADQAQLQEHGFLEENGALIIDVELQVCEKGPWVNKNSNNYYGRMMMNNNGRYHGNASDAAAAAVWFPNESNTVTLSSTSTSTSTSAPTSSNLNTNKLLMLSDNENGNEKITTAGQAGTTMTKKNHFGSLFVSSPDMKNFADVTFLVDGVEFYAHKAVLAVNCPMLLDLVLDYSDNNIDDSDADDDDDDDDDNTNVKQQRQSSSPKQQDCIELQDVKPKVFQRLLEYIYGIRRRMTNDDNKNDNEYVDRNYAKELLLAGNRFGCDELKLYAESVLVQNHLSVETVSDLLTIADSHSCGLLKEASMALIANEPQKVMVTSDWYLVEESSRLLTELLLYYNQHQNQQQQYNQPLLDEKNNGTSNSNGSNSKSIYHNNLDQWNVTSLRCYLEELNLSCDGSREMLINRLLRKEQ